MIRLPRFALHDMAIRLLFKKGNEKGLLLAHQLHTQIIFSWKLEDQKKGILDPYKGEMRSCYQIRCYLQLKGFVALDQSTAFSFLTRLIAHELWIHELYLNSLVSMDLVYFLCSYGDGVRLCSVDCQLIILFLDCHMQILESLLKLPENRECADCQSKCVI